jgi:4-amino-4-deoxy-L-arabinose transferase-like glycosyltransferase
MTLFLRLKALHRHPLTWAIVAVVLLSLPVLSYPLSRDQASYANIGVSILEGGVPYASMWDLKPPPIYYTYALGIAVFGRGWGAIRALDVVLVPLGMVGVFLLGRKLFGRNVGAWGAFFYGAFYFNETFASITQSDSLVTVPMAWAGACAVYASASVARSRRALAYSLLAGALCGVVLWFKHYQAFFVLALVLFYVGQRWRDWGAIAREGAAFCVGGLLTGGGILLYVLSSGMWGDMLITANAAAGYNTRLNDLASVVAQLWHYAQFRWMHWGVLLILVALWLPLCGRGAVRGWRLVWLWVLAGLAFVVIQRLGFDTHWLPLLPSLALLAGGTAEALRERGGRWVGVAVCALVALAPFSMTWGKALPYYTGAIDQYAYYRLFPSGDFRVWESLQVVDYLRPRLTQGDTLYTWGFRPEVAYMGAWRPATRFQTHQPVVAPWFPQAWKDENVATLWAAMPPYVLILQNDNMPWVTGVDADSHTLLQGETELNNWLMANYEREAQVGEFLIWRKKS